MSYATDQVIDQILDKLLTERERSLKLETSLTDARGTLFRIGDLVSSEASGALCEEIAAYVKKAEDNAKALEVVESLGLPDIQRAVSRGMAAAGLTSSGSLRVDCENLARYIESARSTTTGIL
jgi:glycine/D-amino acid oxidase-like deaminating enzyme